MTPGSSITHKPRVPHYSGDRPRGLPRTLQLHHTSPGGPTGEGDFEIYLRWHRFDHHSRPLRVCRPGLDANLHNDRADGCPPRFLSHLVLQVYPKRPL